ncbi:MAG TPA: hypothetical protein VKT49_10290 [Bryobacteraceae bacterium]|nr:hypothetical protein [Bryobacteraceae bacterium]
MNDRFRRAGIAVIIAVAVAACNKHNENRDRGNADRSSPFTDPQTQNADPTMRAPSPIPEAPGSTAGAASGSLQEHPRGGASSGTADRDGRTATRPSEDHRPNVDPSRAESQAGRTNENGTKPGIPGQQRKQ